MSHISTVNVNTLLLNKKKELSDRFAEVEVIAKAALACEGKSVEDALRDCEVTPEHVSCCGLSPGLTSRLFGRSRTKVSTSDEKRGASFQGTSAGTAASTTQKLEAHIASLQVRAQSRREEAVQLFRKGDAASKKAAMRMLQKAKAAERSVTSLEGTLDTMELQQDLQIQTLLSQEVASALGKSSKSMLKKGKKTLLQAEGAVDDARDAMDLAADVESAMEGLRPSEGMGAVDEDDLLKELEQLCEPEAMEHPGKPTGKLENPQALKLPQVPARLPAEVHQQESKAESGEAC